MTHRRVHLAAQGQVAPWVLAAHAAVVSLATCRAHPHWGLETHPRSKIYVKTGVNYQLLIAGCLQGGATGIQVSIPSCFFVLTWGNNKRLCRFHEMVREFAVRAAIGWVKFLPTMFPLAGHQLHYSLRVKELVGKQATHVTSLIAAGRDLLMDGLMHGSHTHN